MKTAILTGATGFVGHWLLRELIENDVFVYAICRKNSDRLHRLVDLKKHIEIIELDMDGITRLTEYCSGADVLYHLAWGGDRNGFTDQMNNVGNAITVMETAKKIGVKHVLVTGSHAEYGPCSDRVDENHPTNPTTAYGACKLSTYFILRVLSGQMGMPFTWVRLFSIYGNDSSNNRLLISYLVNCFRQNKEPELTDCEQLWDFLYAKDAARALYMLGYQGKTGLFNLAYGVSRKLKDFVIEARDLLNPNTGLGFGKNSSYDRTQINVSVDRIRLETGWSPKTSFREGILKFRNE
jgi:UDP-glucose 4-epimerase